MASASIDDTARCYALVPCAGTGERAGAGGPKQYAPVAGFAVVAHTLAALSRVTAIERTLVVLAPADREFESAACAFDGWVERCGGSTRAASVRAGLAALARHGVREHDWVLVHDAARCLVQPAWIERLIDTCSTDPVGGLLALPLADTLKDADEMRRVRATLDRRGKWAAQTPQMFRLGPLSEALKAAGDTVTDEASAMELSGHAPLLVAGDADNFKLTWPEDFVRAERILAVGDEIKAFVPARDFERSVSFYADLGFSLVRRMGDVALLRRGSTSFLLQDFYEPAHADNFVMHLLVRDLDAFAVTADAAASRHGTRYEPPAMRPWGLRDLTLTDPTGVLWRIGERPRQQEKA